MPPLIERIAIDTARNDISESAERLGNGVPTGEPSFPSCAGYLPVELIERPSAGPRMRASGLLAIRPKGRPELPRSGTPRAGYDQ
jgi:hypothetical protein